MNAISKKLVFCATIASLITLGSTSAFSDDNAMHMKNNNMSSNMSHDGMANHDNSMQMDKTNTMSGMNHDSMNMNHNDMVQKDAVYSAKGKIVSINKETKKIEISHEAIPALNWPGMTMNFMYDDAGILDDINVGDSIDFDFISRDKDFVVMDIVAN